MGPHPAVAEVRSAVRRALAGLETGDLVFAASSGGADSLALAAALAFEAPRAGLRAGGVTVDHGLQAGSAVQAGVVCRVMNDLGLDPVRTLTVRVTQRGCGPEAAAREARYAALDRAAEEAGAAAVLLGHTRDDQAETVLLGLARGSGARSLAGMAERSDRYLRPLLSVGRAQTLAACAAQGLDPWHDPQNSDPAFARVRVRARLLPTLEETLGPGVTEALARSAVQLRADADFLDSLAKIAAERTTSADGTLHADALVALPAAIRTRVLRTAAAAAGCPSGALTWRHVACLDDLVTCWHGQRWVDLPGGIRARRRYGRLSFTVTGSRAAGSGAAGSGAAGSGAAGKAEGGCGRE